MSVIIQHKRGLRVNLPASAPSGEEYFCTDTHDVFMGTGTGMVQINAADAKSINGVTFINQASVSKIPIGQPDGTAAWADPLVQGLQAEGTTATGLNPVLVAGKGADGLIHSVSVDNTGKVNIANFPATQTVSGTVTVSGVAQDASVLNPQVTPGTTAPTKINIVGGKTSDGTPQYQAIPLTAAGAAVNVSVSNSPSVSVSNFPATQAISAASLPLPSGASTSAKQPALGTAGTAATDVITVQGIASMTPIKVDGSGVVQPISGTVTANVGTTNGLALDATLTGGTQKTKLVDSAGTNLATISAAGAVKVDGSGVTQPVSGTVAVSNSFALDTSVNGLSLAQNATTSGQKAVLVQAAVTTGAPTYITGNSSPLSVDTSGNLRVTGSFTPASPADTVGTPGTLSALNTTAQVNLAGQNGVGMFLAAGTLIGTIVAELSYDGGTTWVATQFYDPTAQTTASSIVFASANTATTRTILHGGGASQGRVRVSAFTSGTASCTLRSTSNQGAVPVINMGAAGGSSNASVSTTGSAVPASATMVGGSDGTNLRAVKVSTTGVVSVDGSAVTQPISAASLPLPTGASTAAKQPAVGTAGTASADVITVQGIASMTALKVDGSGVTQPVSGTVAVSNSFALDATLTGGTQKTKLVDTGGTNVASVSAAGALKVDNSGVTQPVSGTITANIGTSGSLALDASVTGLQVAQASTTSGQKGGLVLAAVTTAAPTYTTAQSNPLSLTTTGLLRVDGSGVTQPISAASLPLPTGASTAAKQPALGTAGTASADVITIQGIASMTAVKVDGSATTQPVSIAATVATKTVPQTSGGLPLPFSASVNATKQQVKGTAGQVYGYHILNTTAAIAYMQVFNLASAAVTVGTTVPDYVIPLPPSGGATIEISNGIAHSTGITIACTAGRGTNVGATCDVVMLFN